jgi:mannose-6-phosphate isomerase-like protein (cupin superfamily)
MEIQIIKSDIGEEYYTPEKCYIMENVNFPNDPHLSIARARIQPGVTTVNHRLKGVIERYLIIEGEGIVEIGGKTAPVGPGDLVLIPENTPQKITNTGTGDLIFYCICTPGFTQECYEVVEHL